MTCLTWNLEWAPPTTHRGKLIRDAIDAENPDVVCYTEVKRDFVPEGHRIEADADYGYPHNGSRRKVVLWSREPWEKIEVEGDEVLPGGRFASGICRGIRFVGVCIPWRDAHVNSGRKDRARWEDHLLYCEGLGRVLRRYCELDSPVCVLGDYNQRVPRFKQPPGVMDALYQAIPPGFQIATEGMTDADGFGLIDHITGSPGLEIVAPKVIPRFAEDGTRLSDHVGVAANLRPLD